MDFISSDDALAQPTAEATRCRTLGNEKDLERVWDHNAWDDLEWTPEMHQQALDTVAMHEAYFETNRVNNDNSGRTIKQHNDDSVSTDTESKQWDSFYLRHDRWFFKDRKWLKQEFPELFETTVQNILEIGCGVGNTLFPLKRLTSSNVKIHGCDFSTDAIKLVKEHREYNAMAEHEKDAGVQEEDTGRLNVFVHDLSRREEDEPLPLPDNSIDVIVAIFVLSALHPSRLHACINEKLLRVLKPGGILLFRDYGHLDMNQLKMSPSRFLGSPGTYRRGDGTIVHYFTEEELSILFPNDKWTLLDVHSDRRLLVNRKRKLLMRRVWLQAKVQRVEK
jgi:tRNAThr (cytosine32-N3)-methyltransferase